ncbi:MAG: shikimate kinase [Steroidobacteraceae bacterium]
MIGSPNVFLIGPMGSGKTAVGRQVARLLELPFIDSDHEIELRTGADIPLIFEREGEAGFRKREREAIATLSNRNGVVLATGGGAVLDADNRRLLAERGWVVYLETSVAQQAERAGRTRHRPLLSTGDPRQRLEELMQVREPLYRETADFVAMTTRRRVGHVAGEIVQAYRDANASR